MIEFRIDKPSEKQKQFLSAKAKYVAFGGARGGGKSWAIRIKAVLLALNHQGIKIMIIRRTYPELRANHIEPLRAMIPVAIGKYNDSRKEFDINGSKIMFRYCASESDMDNYQGVEADIIFIDEATQFDEIVFRMFAACMRGVNDFPKRLYLTCNPGGVGHAWVKRLFIDRRFKDDENPEDYMFIQSLLQDNPALNESQPDYEAQLKALPPRLREAWLYGNWDVFEGQFFEEFVDDPKRYFDRVNTHVIEPFRFPTSWKIYRSFDWGYAKPFSCGWWAQSHDGVLYRILEMYGCRAGMEDEGLRWTPEQVFSEIAKVEHEHEYLRGKQITGVADPAIWDSQTGPSIADTAAHYGVYFDKGDNKRIPGWMQVHYRLAFDENGYPMMYVFNNCKAFIRTVPKLIYSNVKPEDLDTKMEDHVADEVRYLCMSNPIAPRIAVAPKPYVDDPLGLHTTQRDEYGFFRI